VNDRRGGDIPKIVSVDDHVVEPPNLWTERVPGHESPRVVRRKGWIEAGKGKGHIFHEDESGTWGDIWVYDDLLWPLTPSFAAAGLDRNLPGHRPITFDEIRPGCFQQGERLFDMDANHVEASLCFPTFTRFCGQTFLERGDRDTSLACVLAFNDWIIDEWCGGAGRGRLIPLTLVPLWDVQAAVAEVTRCAAKGSHSIAFSENPVLLGLPSIHSDYWDPLWAVCQETDTVVNCHIGSSSRLATTGPESPNLVTIALTFQGALHAAIDILLSGVFERYPGLRIALSEGQVGWLPFVLERLDKAWDHSRAYGEVGNKVKKPPSTYVEGHLYGCLFDDLAGLSNRSSIGMSQLMFEVDYPHQDSTWPNTLGILEGLIAEANLSDVEVSQLVRGNAIGCYGLDRYGIVR
jgi:predicted TIM-barrel fold metal-dependent hydrolase